MGNPSTLPISEKNCVKLPYQGENVDAQEVEFTTHSEAVGVFTLPGDGIQIEFHHQVKTIYRLVDKKKDDGTPIYIVTGAASLTTKPIEKSEADV
jgi:hypothetical protein